jgi:uncharacterized protein
MLECAELSNERSFLFSLVYTYWKTQNSKLSQPADNTLSGARRQTPCALNWSALQKEYVMRPTINWFEIPVTDMARALKFYQAVTGLAMRSEQFGAPGEEMATFPVDNMQTVTGCLQLSPYSKPSQDGSLIYLNASPGIDAWIGRVEKAGGKIITPKTALPGDMGFFAIFLDCEGNRVGLFSQA